MGPGEKVPLEKQEQSVLVVGGASTGLLPAVVDRLKKWLISPRIDLSVVMDPAGLPAPGWVERI